MNIFGQNYNLIANPNTIVSQNVQGQGEEGQLNMGAQFLSALKQGQVFHGEITNITYQDVTILLDNMQLLTAKFGEKLELTIGQQMYFEIKENSEEAIVIHPIVEDTEKGQLQLYEKMLETNGLSISDKNISIVKELMSAGQPVNQATIRTILQQTIQYPNTSIAQLVEMRQAGIPINESNIAAYVQYQTLEHSLLEQTKNATQMLSAKLQDLQSGEQINSYVDKVLTALSTEENSQLQTIDSNKLPSIESEVSLNMKDNLEWRQELEMLQMSENDIDLVFRGLNKDDPKDVIHVISNWINSMAMDGEEQKITFLKGNTFHKLLDKAIQSNWTLQPEQIENGKNIDDYYQRIYQQTARLQKLFFNSENDSDDSLKKQLQTIRQNIEFIQDINQSLPFHYAQIPIKFHNQDANSELYIYKNKKKAADSENEHSVLLHLEMEHLGKTDIYVQQVGNSIHTRFYLSDDKSVSLVQEHIQDLSDAITNRGFEHSNETVLREKIQNGQQKKNLDYNENLVVKEVLSNTNQVDASHLTNRYTFDVRM